MARNENPAPCQKRKNPRGTKGQKGAEKLKNPAPKSKKSRK